LAGAIVIWPTRCGGRFRAWVLNLGEGMGSRAGIRRARYRTALGSMREVLACIDVGAIFGYVVPLSPEAANRCAHVVGTLVKLTA